MRTQLNYNLRKQGRYATITERIRRTIYSYVQRLYIACGTTTKRQQVAAAGDPQDYRCMSRHTTCSRASLALHSIHPKTDSETDRLTGTATGTEPEVLALSVPCI